MKPSAEQEIMLEQIRDSSNLPASFKSLATGLLENYDPVKHAELDLSIKDWEEKPSQ